MTSSTSPSEGKDVIYFCSNECARCRKSPLTNCEKKLNRMLCNACYKIVEGREPPTLESVFQ